MKQESGVRVLEWFSISVFGIWISDFGSRFRILGFSFLMLILEQFCVSDFWSLDFLEFGFRI